MKDSKRASEEGQRKIGEKRQRNRELKIVEVHLSAMTKQVTESWREAFLWSSEAPNQSRMA